MSQKKDNFRNSANFNVYIPKNSTQITSGDVVCMPRKWSPRSRAYFGALSRISPMSTVGHAPFVVGVADSDFNTTAVGTTLYAAPTANQAIPVYKNGTFALAITNTAGNAGDLIKFSSGATGAQLFTIDNGARPGLAIGYLTKSFSGATANDTQLVTLIPKDENGIDMAWWLENRALEGFYMQKHSANAQASSQINVGVTVGTTNAQRGQANWCIIQGKRFRLTRVTDVTVGPNTGGGASCVRMRMVVARSNDILCRTCTIALTYQNTNIATWTLSKVTAGYFVPRTITSGEVVIGYVVAFSATAVTYTNAKMISLVGTKSEIPRYGHWSV